MVGRYGYKGASVARIAARAKIAHGTFYNYFKSRQDLLDQLLPAFGDRMLDFIREHSDPRASGPQRESQRLRAYFMFLAEHPWFHRLLHESEVLAPKASEIYLRRVADGYIRSLTRSVDRGEIEKFSDKELEILAYILMSLRVYLAQRYAYSNGTVHEPPEEVFKTYRKFIEGALFK